MKKETVVIGACVVLFIILIALLFFEMRYPEGGVKLIESLFGR